MQSRWKKIGNFPKVSYLDKDGYGLTLNFFDRTGDVFVSFTNPSDALVRACGQCIVGEAKEGSHIKCIFLDNFNMKLEGTVRHTIDAMLEFAGFEDSAKQEIRGAVNSHYAKYNKANAKIGLFEPVPMTPQLQANFEAIRKANTPWYRRR